MTAKILIADDEPSVRLALEKVLLAEGHEVELAEDGPIAIEKIREKQPDLLLLDIGLPLRDGWTVLEWVTKLNPFLPVIVITGRWKQAEKAEASGADFLMEKPLDVTMLLQNIRQLLDEPIASRARRINERRRDFQSVACDPNRFRESMLSRVATPFKWLGFKNK